MTIENVSDTARWVAVYRAIERARPDAIFRDPFAERLAGRRGQEIVDQLPHGRASAWPMIVRTGGSCGSSGSDFARFRTPLIDQSYPIFCASI